jgi:hypothetical protein
MIIDHLGLAVSDYDRSKLFQTFSRVEGEAVTTRN